MHRIVQIRFYLIPHGVVMNTVVTPILLYRLERGSTELFGLAEGLPERDTIIHDTGDLES